MIRSISVLLILQSALIARAQEPLSVLLLGDQGHHRPADFAAVIKPALANRGVNITYTEDVSALAADDLKNYDCVAIYRDSGDLPADAEAGLLSFVESGRGLVALHCASHCFRNSQKYTALVGGRFDKHGRETFRAKIIDAQHPATRDVKSFASSDETYTHNELADDIRVLMVREHAGGYEPWTWVREQGKGRVFYTASGHDTLTWREPAFQGLVESGIRWASGQKNEDKPKLEQIPARVPKYVVAGRTTEDLPTMQAPLSPADSMKHMHLPEGLEVQLFAAEPDVIKPIAMNFDHRGRLWVIESVDYPNRLLNDPHKNGEDRIKICEDTDGDGRADKFTIFADKLNIPTALAFANGGVLVALAPHVLFMKDTDGDDKADVREILLTGFGRQDTHAVHSNLHYGHDNWMYASVGYSGGQVEVGGTVHRFRQGFLRFKTDGSAFEVLTSTSNNTWGLGIGETGEVFGSTANNEHAVHLGIPNRYFESVRGWLGRGSDGIEDHKEFHPVTDAVRQVDWFGGFTAASGFELITAGGLPEEYRGMALVCEPTGHLVHLDKLEQEGTEFIAHDAYNLLASTDAWTAPIAAQTGPDGAVWVLDWYNYIVQHNPTPHGFETGEGAAYVTPLRDKKHGRIYRIVHHGGKQSSSPQVDGATPSELIAALGHDNLFWRLAAQRLLVERGRPDVVSQLAEVVKESDNPRAAAHALRTLAGLGEKSEEARRVSVRLVSDAFRHNDEAVRIAALAAIPRNKAGVDLVLKSGALSDQSALVRKNALLALAQMPGSREAGAAVAQLLSDRQNAADRWIPLAATSAAAQSDVAFLQSIASTRITDRGNRQVLDSVKTVAQHYARGGSSEGLTAIITALGEADPRLAEAAVAGFTEGWPENQAPEIDDELIAALSALLKRVPTSTQLQIAALANRWDAGEKFAAITKELQETLLTEIEQDDGPEAARMEAAQRLIATSDNKEIIERLLDVISLKSSPELAGGLLNAVAGSKADAAGEMVVERLSNFSPAARNTAIALLLRRPAWTEALLDAVDAGDLRADDLALDQRQQLSLHPDKRLAERANKLFGEVHSDRAEIVHEFLKLANQRGDRAHGKEVFTQQCAKCHRHSGEGNTVGPDLTGMAVHPREELLVHILDPSRSVEGNYRQYSVLTDDGRVLSGLLASETKTAVEILDAEAKRHAIIRESIDEMVASQKSMMPEGFEKLPEKDLVDLLEFLTTPGKYLPLPLAKAATIASTGPLFYGQDAAETLVLQDWAPRTVQGVPFHLIDPQGGRAKNVVMLHGPLGKFPPEMPKHVTVPCNIAALAVHMLSGASGWGYPATPKGTVSMIVRLHYADGTTEDHELRNGEHFSDYIREVDVPGSKLAFKFRGQQMRYLAIQPKRKEVIKEIELVKGNDPTAPLVMAITAEVLSE